MAILQTAFTCTNGHSFTANAKLRARCPQCGQLARKDFTATPANPEASQPSNGSIKSPILLRQGKSMPRHVKKPAATVKPKAPHTYASRAGAVNRAPAKVSGGTVKMHSKVAKGIMPKVKGAPPKTAIARHIENRSSKPSITGYADEMMERFGVGR